MGCTADVQSSVFLNVVCMTLVEHHGFGNSKGLFGRGSRQSARVQEHRSRAQKSSDLEQLSAPPRADIEAFTPSKNTQFKEILIW